MILFVSAKKLRFPSIVDLVSRINWNVLAIIKFLAGLWRLGRCWAEHSKTSRFVTTISRFHTTHDSRWASPWNFLTYTCIASVLCFLNTTCFRLFLCGLFIASQPRCGGWSRNSTATNDEYQLKSCEQILKHRVPCSCNLLELCSVSSVV